MINTITMSDGNQILDVNCSVFVEDPDWGDAGMDISITTTNYIIDITAMDEGRTMKEMVALFLDMSSMKSEEALISQLKNYCPDYITVTVFKKIYESD